MPTNTKRDGSAKSGQQPETRIENAIQSRELHVGLQIFLTHCRETMTLAHFLTIRAHHAHTRKILLRACTQLTELRLHPLKLRVHSAPQSNHQHGQADHGKQREARQHWTDAQHHDQRKKPPRNRIREVHNRWPCCHAHSAQVICKARHEIARPPAHIPRRIQ